MADNFGMKERKKNLEGLWSDPRKRFMVIVMGILIIAMIAYGLFSGGSQAENKAQETGTQGINNPNVEARPGAVKDATYVKAVNDENEERLKAAQKSGGSFIPTPTANTEAPSIDPLADATTAPQVQQPQVNPYVAPTQVESVPQPGVSPPVQQPARLTVDDVQKTERFKNMEKQFDRYVGAWVIPSGGQEFSYKGQVVEKAAETSVANASGSAIAQGQSTSSASQTQSPAIVRAGTIIPAILLSPINSDAPGAVLAEIVSGPFNGARLLGTFQSTEKDIVVRFNTLSIPGEPRSFSINAVAVNDDLGSGVATDVNNHYFLRYGLRFAAGFAKGYANYITRGGTETVLGTGGIVVTQDKLSTREVNRAAIGDGIGDIASDLSSSANIRPTVKAQGKDGQKLPVGILFMSDF